MAERLTKVQRDNVQCTKEVKGERKKGRKPPDPLKGEGNEVVGERTPPDPLKGEGNAGRGERKPPSPLKGEGNAGRGERKVKTKTLPVREALLQELL